MPPFWTSAAKGPRLQSRESAAYAPYGVRGSSYTFRSAADHGFAVSAVSVGSSQCAATAGLDVTRNVSSSSAAAALSFSMCAARSGCGMGGYGV